MTIIKICGITNLEDAITASEAGADILGFIFYPPSARYVPPETVRKIVQSSTFNVQNRQKNIELETLNLERPAFVGVFVNSPADEIRQVMDFCGLDFAQLHGDESPEMVANFDGGAFKAINPQSLAEAEQQAQKFFAPSPLRERVRTSPFILLDAFHPTERGGTGKTADWGLAAQLARSYPILLAGGLTPENVARAIATVHPLGVDVSSGVETFKGKKDPDKVRAFIEQVRK